MSKIRGYLSVAVAITALAIGGTAVGSAEAAAPARGDHVQAQGAPHVMSDTIIRPRATLYRNQAWTSGNGRAILRLQEDGNFVLYKDGAPVWQAPGAWGNGAEAVFQEDGNFVLYDGDGKPIWASDTWGRGAYLAVQDDGNVVVYDGSNNPVWATNTGD